MRMLNYPLYPPTCTIIYCAYVPRTSGRKKFLSMFLTVIVLLINL